MTTIVSTPQVPGVKSLLLTRTDRETDYVAGEFAFSASNKLTDVVISSRVLDQKKYVKEHDSITVRTN